MSRHHVGIVVSRTFRKAEPYEIKKYAGLKALRGNYLVETRSVFDVHATKGLRMRKTARQMIKTPYGGIPKEERRYIHTRPSKHRFMDRLQVRP